MVTYSSPSTTVLISLFVTVVLALLPDAASGRHLRYVPMNSQTILDMMKDRSDPKESKIAFSHEIDSSHNKPYFSFVRLRDFRAW